uniref:hypothetical protein n=1 Tax=Xylella fastidiosa TaxID=2371 RepID=UPI0019D472B2
AQAAAISFLVSDTGGRAWGWACSLTFNVISVSPGPCRRLRVSWGDGGIKPKAKFTSIAKG